MKTEWLKTFAEVVATGSFSEAARKMGVSAMAVSKQVTSLEQAAGEAVFERSTRSLRLTGFGQALHEHARALLSEKEILDEWLVERSSEPAGTIRVLGQEKEVLDITLVPWVGEFLARYPKIELEIDLQADVIDVNRHPADVYWGVGDYLGQLAPGLRRRRMYRSRIGVFASPGYIERHGRPRHPEDLHAHQLVTYLHNKPNNRLYLNTGTAESPAIDAVAMKTSVRTVTGTLELACQGLGLINSEASYWEVENALEEGRLVSLMEPYWIPRFDLYAYYHQVKVEQPKVRAFIDFFAGKCESFIER